MISGPVIAAPGLIRGTEGRIVSVQQSIENETQRIEIGSVIVASAVIDFGSHVLEGADAAHGHHLVDGGHFSGDTEITQLETGFFAVKEVAGLDVPVEDIAALTETQGGADIHSQTQDVAAVHITRSHKIVVQALQLLHADQESAASRILQHGVIFNYHNAGGSFELHHQVDLFAHTAHKILQSLLTGIPAEIRAISPGMAAAHIYGDGVVLPVIERTQGSLAGLPAAGPAPVYADRGGPFRKIVHFLKGGPSRKIILIRIRGPLRKIVLTRKGGPSRKIILIRIRGPSRKIVHFRKIGSKNISL